MPDLSKLSDDELIALHQQATSAAPTTIPRADLSKLSDEQLLRLHQEALGRARPKVEPGESAIRGAVQGASFGYSDEAVGLGGGLYEWAKGGEFAEGYRKHRDESRLRNQEAYLDNPKTYIGGSIAGGVATSFVPGLGIAKGATLLGGMSKAALLGGAAAGGLSEAELTDKATPESVTSFGGDVLKGAAIGAAAQGALTLVSKAANALKPSELEKLANTKAAKAAGALGSDLKKLGPEKTQAMGEAVRKAGLKAFDSLDDVGEKIAASKGEAGAAIGKALESVDDLVVKAKDATDSLNIPAQAKANLKDAIDKNFQFNMQRIGERIEDELIKPNAKNPLLDLERSKLQDIADRFKSIGQTTMREGNIIKGTQGRLTNFNSETVPQAFKQEVYGIIKRELDDVVAKTGTLEAGVEKLTGGAANSGGRSLLGNGPNAAGTVDANARNQSVLQAYTQAKKTYGALSDAERINIARQGSLAGNREISLTDTIAGVGGMATGGPAGAVVAGGLNKLARKYGDSVMAVGAAKAAEIIERAPQRLGRFYTILADAAKNGAPALDATHIALMKDPDYRAILENFEKTQAIQRRIGGAK